MDINNEVKSLTAQQKKNLRKWVKALESGKYKQTDGILRDKNGYCCLGVACDVLKIKLKCKDNVYYYGKEQTIDSLPIEATKALGIDSNGNFPGYDFVVYDKNSSYESLIDLNDEGGYSFKNIAKIIRKFWLGEKNIKIKGLKIQKESNNDSE